MEVENKNLKKGKVLKIIGWIIVILALLGIIPSFLAGMGCPDCVYVTWMALVFVIFPLLSLGIVLILWGRYLIKKRNKVFTILVTILLSFIIFRPIGYSLYKTGIINSLLAEKTKIITEKAIKKKNEKLCYKIRVISFLPQFFSNFLFIGPERDIAQLQAQCVSKVAVSEENELLCDSLSKKVAYLPYALGLKNECYTEVAKKKKDLKICEKLEKGVIPDLNICYQEVYMSSENICQGLKNTSEKDECIKNTAIESKDMQMCKGIWGDHLRVECQREIKIATEDILAPCRTLSTPGEKNGCIEKVAVKTDNIELCSLIPGYAFEAPKSCFKQLILFGEKDNIEGCQRISSPLAQRACLFEVAVNNDDLEMCNRSEGDYQRYCFTGIAIKRNNPEICKMIADEVFDQPECFKDLAVTTKNLEICNKIRKGYLRDSCYAYVAGTIKDESICERITDYKDLCYFLVARAKNDLNLCGKVKEESKQEECQKELSTKDDRKIKTFKKGI